MFWRKYKFIKDPDSFMVYDRDKNFLWSLPNDFNDLSQEVRKSLQKRMRIPKILIIVFFNTLSVIIFPFFVLKYKNYIGLLLYIWFISMTIWLIITNWALASTDSYTQILSQNPYWYIWILMMIIAEILFIARWTKTAYDNKAYSLLSQAFELQEYTKKEA